MKKLSVKPMLFLLLGSFLFLACEKDSKTEHEWKWDDETPELIDQDPLVIAHRGASGYEIQNSIAAFKKADALGADGIELDIWRTADDSLIVFHDKDTEKLTGVKQIIPQSTFKELRSLQLSNGEKIPTLREVIHSVSDTTIFFIEIKCCWEAGKAGQVFPLLSDLLIETRVKDRVVINSFNIANAAEVKTHIPDVPYYLLSYQKEDPDIIVNRAVDGGCAGINISYLLISDELLTQARENDLKVCVWGVDTEELAIQMFESDVDGITTDYPDIIKGAFH